jgi:DNA-binding PadR family transcriptional regulator
MTTRLPTTSFAVLGLLAVRSWTAYELTQQYGRSLRYCWPKAESVLYEELRRLARQSLAVAKPEVANGRRRTRYAISEAGRAELARWLTDRGAKPSLEFEPMLRLLFADQGELDDLRRSIGELRGWAEENLRAGIPLVADFVATGGPLPARNHLSVLFARFFADFYELTLKWCDLAIAEVDTWESTADQGMTDGTRRIAESLLERFANLAPEAAVPGSAAGARRADRQR